MKISTTIFSFLALLGSIALADIHYVDINNATPSAPYTSWDTAATDIQSAIDLTSPGDMVLIADGEYYVNSTITVTNAITIRSVNGAEKTIVAAIEETAWGLFQLGKIQDVACTLDGLTISNGYQMAIGGGVRCWGGIESSARIENCRIINNHTQYRLTTSASGGGGIYGGTVSNCFISGNSAPSGGGCSDCVIYDSTIINNSTTNRNNVTGYGGGVSRCVAIRCTVRNNTSTDFGGGVDDSTVFSSLIISNSAYVGGGVSDSKISSSLLTRNFAAFGGALYLGSATNCPITENTATTNGACAYDSTLVNCKISSNTSLRHVGGLYKGTAMNCTFSENSAELGYGGTYDSSLINTIAWNNSTPDTYAGTATNSCSPNLDDSMNENIAISPQFVSSDDYHLQPTSPCINAGANTYVIEPADLDGNPRVSGDAVDMGAYEYQIGRITGCSNLAPGFSIEWNQLPGCNSVIMYSTNLVTMPFTDLSAPMPFPLNCYTDTVHGAEAQCFYKIEMVP